jgi:hypothetical protein
VPFARSALNKAFVFNAKIQLKNLKNNFAMISANFISQIFYT